MGNEYIAPFVEAAQSRAPRRDEQKHQNSEASTKQHSVQDYNALSLQQLLDVASREPAELEKIVSARPSQAARLAQLAVQQGRLEQASLILEKMRVLFLATNGVGSRAELMFRGVLGLEGTGDAMIRTTMGLFLVERDKKVSDSMPLDARPEGAREVDAKSANLRHAGSDPAWGRLYARFFDDPSAAAQQLKDEASNDPAKFRLHASQLSWMIKGSPASSQHFVRAVMHLKGPGTINVKRWVVSEIHEAITPDMMMADRGYNDMIDGGPMVRAERLIPLLAEIVAQPEVAHSLVAISNGVGTDLPPNLPALEHLLQDILLHSWTQATRAQVRETISQGAAEMFRESVMGTDEKEIRATSAQTATFIGTAAKADSEVGIEPSIAAAVATMLTGISKVLSGPYKRGVVIAAAGIGALDPKTKAEAWEPTVTNSLMRAAYEQVKARPRGRDDYPEVVKYNNEYTAWREGPANAYDRVYKETAE